MMLKRCPHSPASRRHRPALVAAVFVLAASFASPGAKAQSLDRLERERAQAMLSAIKNDIKKNYYDPTFRGIDLDARFKEADEKLKQAASLGQAFGIIAQVLLDFNDSHTKFIPPRRPETIEYGWDMQMIGDKCYVVAVKPGSDAAAQGLKEGDLVLAVERFKPARKEFWKMRYYYNLLSPRAALQLVVQSPGGQPRELGIKSKVRAGQRIVDLTTDIGINDYLRELEDNYRSRRHRYFENVGGAFVWKMPAFDLADGGIDELMGKAKNSSALVLDLRGNGGGYETTLLRMLGHFFNKDLKVADVKERKQIKPMIAKTRGNAVYGGKVVVLVDSDSASSAELFARVMQLEKRGLVVGDLSSGKVMRSRFHQHDMGTSTLVSFGASVTDADAIMTDGQSLEHIGVTPDELILPTAEDMAVKRDVALARALELAGVKMTPEKAGALFPVEWEK